MKLNDWKKKWWSKIKMFKKWYNNKCRQMKKIQQNKFVKFVKWIVLLIQR